MVNWQCSQEDPDPCAEASPKLLWVALIITCVLPPPLPASRKEPSFLVTLAACPLPGQDCWWDKDFPFACSTDVLLGSTRLIPSALQREEPRATQVCSWLSNTAALHSCKFPGSSAVCSSLLTSQVDIPVPFILLQSRWEG